VKYSVLAVGGVLLVCGITDADSSRISSISKVIVQPNTRLARPMNREPTPEEISRLERVVGCTPEEVIRRLGHPRKVIEHDDNRYIKIIWEYPWGDPKNPTENVTQISSVPVR
jgi:hypothetical protein